ncbi:MAG TPA: ABC transporter ATP-binding protein [Aggregatilineales bacterium]|nr:ABC transporter ATP-binding protein [Aggregatilineales bacterium]
MSDRKIIIEVKGASKRYTQNEYRPSLRQEAAQMVKGLLKPSARKAWEPHPFWALKDINFEVAEGESLGIIGRNGAGKTTLLRLLSGITEPTEGIIHVRGRFVALVGLGAGFNFERSGRENIYLNAAIFGMPPKEIDEFLNDIIEFSELGDFIERPIKRYSSGMISRLAFSIAIHILPDIIFLDEILAVGDVAFREKCVDRIFAFKEENRTLLFVSHSSLAVSRLCERSIWLHEGKQMMVGPTDDVVDAYHEFVGQVPGADMARWAKAEDN